MDIILDQFILISFWVSCVLWVFLLIFMTRDIYFIIWQNKIAEMLNGQDFEVKGILLWEAVRWIWNSQPACLGDSTSKSGNDWEKAKCCLPVARSPNITEHNSLELLRWRKAVGPSVFVRRMRERYRERKKMRKRGREAAETAACNALQELDRSKQYCEGAKERYSQRSKKGTALAVGIVTYCQNKRSFFFLPTGASKSLADMQRPYKFLVEWGLPLILKKYDSKI